jgi:hypothetical protein
MYVLTGRKSSKNRAQAEIVEFTVGVLGSGQVRVVHCVRGALFVVLSCAVVAQPVVVKPLLTCYFVAVTVPCVPFRLS